MWTSATAPIVVGLKDVAGAPGLLRLAGREASLRARPLYLVHAFVWPLFPEVDRRDSRSGPVDGGGHATMIGNARRMLSEAAARVRYAHPDVGVSAEVLDGDAGQVLLRLARDALLVVVGSDRLGRTAALPHDSVAIQLAARARCPVLLGRGAGRTVGPVVVGVDGSPDGRLALSLATNAARLRGVGVLAVHANEPAGQPDASRYGQPDVVVTPPADLLPPPADLLTPPIRGEPTVPVVHRTVMAAPADVLVAASRAAQLMVIGARGWRCDLLGPVAQAVLHHAHCPVTVVRERRAGQLEGRPDRTGNRPGDRDRG